MTLAHCSSNSDILTSHLTNIILTTTLMVFINPKLPWSVRQAYLDQMK